MRSFSCLITHLLRCLPVVGLVVLSLSCRNDTPEGILSASEMESVLYDYHLAQRLGEMENAASITKDKSWKYNEHYYMKSALAKHGLTQADFDRSLEWYTRHSGQLLDIYKKLDERASAETGSSMPATAMAGNGLRGDTTDIWKGNRMMLLSSSGKTHYSFEQAADTSFHSADRLTLNFQTAWIYREGSKAAVAMLAVVYAGDSVDVRTISIYNTGKQTLSVTIGDRPVKAVRGFIYQQVAWSAKPKLLLLSGISLIKVRAQAGGATGTGTGDNGQLDQTVTPVKTPEQKLRDSLLRSDSLTRSAPHFREAH